MSIIGLFTQELDKTERHCSSGLGISFTVLAREELVRSKCVALFSLRWVSLLFAAMQELLCNECHYFLRIGIRMGIENRTWLDFDREQVRWFVPGDNILVTPKKVLNEKKWRTPGKQNTFLMGFLRVDWKKWRSAKIKFYTGTHNKVGTVWIQISI